MDKKKILIVGVVILLIVVALIVILGRKSSDQIAKVNLSGKITFPDLSPDHQSLLYIDAQDNKIKRYEFSSQKQEILSADIGAITQAYWSPDTQKVILSNQGDKITLKLYDLQSKSSKDMDSKIESLIWSPDSKKIYYHFYDEDQNISQLNVSLPDGTNWQNIVDLQYPSYKFVWVGENKLGYWTPPSDISGTNLDVIDLATKETKEIFNDYRLADALVSNNSQKIVYEKFDKNNSTLSLAVANIDGKNDIDTKLQSSVAKSVWISNELLITAVKIGESEKLYKISSNGEKSEIKIKSDQPFDSQDFMVVDEKNIYFTSSGNLYKLRLN